MKKFGLFLCLSLLFAFTGCDKDETEDPVANTQLAKPEVSIASTTESSFKVVWEAVADAEGYKYQLAQEGETGEEIPVIAEQTTSATALSFDDLEPETKYILRVKAYAGGMEDSAYCKIFATTLAEEREPLTFTSISVSNVTYESATVELVPAAEDLYYYAVIEYSQFENKSDAEIISALKSGITASSLVSGRQTKTVHGLKESTKYQVVAFGWNADEGKATSDVSHLEEAFTTEADTRLSIEIGIGSVTDQEATVTYTPTPSDGTYFADVIEASLIAGKSDMEIVSYLQTEHADNKLQDIRYTGTKSKTYQISASTDYVAVAFAYDTEISELTSLMFTQAFSSGMPEGNSIFTITVSNIGKTSADVDVKTSDPEMYYFLAGYPTTLEAQVGGIENMTTEIVAMLNDNCSTYGFDIVAESMLYQGNIGGSFKLSPNTEYKIYALGVTKESDKSLKTVTTMATSEAFKTLEDNSKYPAVSFNYEVIDGGLIDPQYAGMKVLYLTFTPNSLCTNYFFNYYSDAEEYSDTQIIAALKSSGFDQSDTIEDEYAVAFSNQDHITIAAVGVDANGKTGNLSRITINLEIGEYGTVEGDGESSPEEIVTSQDYKKYLGDWTVTSTSSVLLKQPVTFNITVEENIPDVSYAVTGWSTSSLREDFKTIWTYDSEYKAFLINAMEIMTFNDQTYGTCSLEYQPICYCHNEDSHTIVRCSDMYSTMAGMAVDENQVIVMGSEDVDAGWDIIDFVGMEICAYTEEDADGNVWVLTYRAADGYTDGDYPIGPYTLTRKTTSGTTTSSVKPRTNSMIKSLPTANTATKVSMSSILGNGKYMMPETLLMRLKAKVGTKNNLQGQSLNLSDEQMLKLQYKVASQKLNVR